MTLEVFYDYACPYCKRGYELLTALLPDYPGLEVEWHPCEAHPRPERFGPHSDLPAKGFFFARDNGEDVDAYHERMYDAALTARKDIEDPDVVCSIGLPGSKELQEALYSGAYQRELDENNRLAWEVHGFSAVPSLRMNGKLLPSVEDVGLNEEMIRAFLAEQVK